MSEDERRKLDKLIRKWARKIGRKIMIKMSRARIGLDELQR